MFDILNLFEISLSFIPVVALIRKIYIDLYEQSYGPRPEKTCLRGFSQSELQTGLLSYRD